MDTQPYLVHDAQASGQAVPPAQTPQTMEPQLQVMITQLARQEAALEELKKNQKKMKSRLGWMVFGAYLRLFFVVVPLLGALFLAYVYLPSKLAPILPQIEQIMPTLNNLNNQANAVSDVFSTFSPDQMQQMQGIMQLLQ